MKPQCIHLNAGAKLTNVNNQRKDLGTYLPLQDQGALYRKTQSASIQDGLKLQVAVP